MRDIPEESTLSEETRPTHTAPAAKPTLTEEADLFGTVTSYLEEKTSMPAASTQSAQNIQQVIPSLVSLYTSYLLSQNRKNDFKNQTFFYLHYLCHRIQNENIPTIPMLEIKAWLETSDNRTPDDNILILSGLILSHQKNGPDNTEIYSIFNDDVF